MTSVLYDVPGPKAIVRNRIIAVLTVLLVGAVLGFILYRFALSGQFSAQKWGIFTYSAIWAQIFQALGKTLAAFGLAAVGSIVLGFVLAIGRLSDHRWVRIPFMATTEIFRAVPVLVMMMLLYYGLPSVGVKMEPYWAVVIALVVYNGSVLAEALRAGIESLPRGQKEAGYAIGLRKSGVMRLILLPQAVRAMLPVIVAQLVVTMKDTALGFIITYPELLYLAKQLSSNVQFGRPLLQSAFVIGGIYIIMCLILSGIAKWLEVRMSKNPRARGGAAAADTSTVPIQPGDPRLHTEGTMTEVIVTQGDEPRSRR
ncbi:amino acid ABC transporter permease [Leucobacter massiliensis]|uniref:Amino acid ABC transporter permease n=1 Tax=Leucobacter massiliensis TaxID=1686285 RepID=A0A2S9QKX1_9MICO|nr:amino acid ABC transporter permease [Leucobacter massiliensis]PRI10236.1 amino acid ABC transporter permease [Leucobacter massiliensis]